MASQEKTKGSVRFNTAVTRHDGREGITLGCRSDTWPALPNPDATASDLSTVSLASTPAESLLFQFAGTVPVYEAVMPAQPQQTFVATSTAPVSTSPIYMQPMPQYGQPVPQMGHPMGTTLVQAMSVQQAYPYGYGYQQQKTEGPLKRFLRGAADGFMLGTMGWMG
ncbi:unnamed protein product [Nippostrongylus brasiliensis]|uniref:DAZ-associated protein 2 n=1 Tax=Nippostrongylus brasiliensis TaxID=27835 RepID=A0A0N4Y4G5_NIPBR|nr:unnamed protein product [Nippostrongylus brasiliensis]